MKTNSLTILAVSAALTLGACSPQPAPKTETVSASAPAVALAPSKPVDVPAGTYTIDKSHASLTFRLSHLGLTNYTARFLKFDAQLQLDPSNLSTATVNATIDPLSLDLNTPPPGFQQAITGADWLNAAQFPAITFKSTKVEVTAADNSVRITGDLSLHGVTHPVVLYAKLNGGYAGFAMDPHARVGFSAHGTLKRSDFGITVGIPAPGTTMGVGDEISFDIEAEFSGPAWTPPATDTAPAKN